MSAVEADSFEAQQLALLARLANAAERLVTIFSEPLPPRMTRTEWADERSFALETEELERRSARADTKEPIW